MALNARQIAWLVFLVTLLIYWSLVPWVSRQWRLTGDEPHYLVVTHSLLTDRDLDLANNYQEKDFTLFYSSDALDPHVNIGPDGAAYPAHTIGLSVALLPAYALGYLVFIGHAGVLYFLAATGALLSANVYLLCYEITGRKFSSLLSWVATAFTVPVMHYSFQVYPEILGALLLVWSLRHIRRGRQTKPHIWLIVGVCVAFLPWLVTRFALLSLVLGPAALLAIAFAQGTRRWNRLSIIALCLPVILSCVVLLAFDLRFYGEITPAVGAGGSTGAIPDFVRTPSVEKAAEAVAGSLFDQDAGLLIYSPVYALAFLGLLLMLRTRRNDGLLLSLPIVSTCLGVIWIGFAPGWGIQYRYLVVILPLAGVALAYSLQQMTSPVFRAVGLLLLAVALTRTPLVLREPMVAHAPEMQGESATWAAYDRLLPLPLRPYVPSLRQQFAVIYARGRATGEMGSTVKDPEAEGLYGGLASTQMVAWADSELEEKGYILDRRWPDTEAGKRFLPPGAYAACFRMKTEQGTPTDIVVAVIDATTEQATLGQKQVARGDLPQTGYGVSCVPFYYPGRQEVRLRVLFTDQADLWLDWMSIRGTDSTRWWVLAGLWLAVLAAFTAYYYLRYRNVGQLPGQTPRSAEPEDAAKGADSIFPVAAEIIVALTIAVVLGNHLYLVLTPTTFEAEDLPRVIGETVTDDDASGGRAAHASRDFETNALVYGPYEFFQPGDYAARFRMKVGGGSPDTQGTAVIDVHGEASNTLALLIIGRTDFLEAQRYQEFYLRFSNPAYQALQFRVQFLGGTDLWVDKITVERVFSGQG